MRAVTNLKDKSPVRNPLRIWISPQDLIIDYALWRRLAYDSQKALVPVGSFI